jgi:hypothetical protein
MIVIVDDEAISCGDITNPFQITATRSRDREDNDSIDEIVRSVNPHMPAVRSAYGSAVVYENRLALSDRQRKSDINAIGKIP